MIHKSRWNQGRSRARFSLLLIPHRVIFMLTAAGFDPSNCKQRRAIATPSVSDFAKLDNTTLALDISKPW